MCSRYFITDPLTGIRREFRPGDKAEVLTADRTGRIVKRTIVWGFSEIPKAGTVFNARSETALEKKLFRESVLHRRCVILADGFYEWNRAKEKAVFRDDGGGELYLAGFYEFRQDSERFVILTTDANESMRGVHDRMPLLLRKEQVRSWILDDKKVELYLRQRPFELKKEMEYEQQIFEFLL